MIHYDSGQMSKSIVSKSTDKLVIFFLILCAIVSGIISLLSLAIQILFQAVQLLFIPGIIFLFLILSVYVFVELYFKSKNFISIKKSFVDFVNDCNGLNEHINALKEDKKWRGPQSIGQAFLSDASKFNFQRSNWSRIDNFHDNINCSLSICKNAKIEPIKYVSKYFNIKPTEENLTFFENVLNDFESVNNGRKSLIDQQETLISSLSTKIPKVIIKFWNIRLKKELGFLPIEMEDIHFQTFTFQYVSSGGNSSAKCDIILDLVNLNNLVFYLNDRINFQKSVQGQRALMTSQLRVQIKERDNYTCKLCSNSSLKEPNLLLEIDHIVPISKGGLTTISNLQTLCWRCNREKGSKIV